jgi:N-acyl-D-aspartate/D-glutamate deacylase
MSGGNCLIRGGMVVDGTGAAGYAADVRVRGGRIAEVGPNLTGEGEPQLDAAGCAVTPGFIDSHSHYDATLFWDPRCDPIVQHGVTTVLIGNCALGMAPVRAPEREALGALFSYIEDLPKQVFDRQVPWNWESFPEYARRMREQQWGLNIATCVSHSLLRQYAMGPAAWERAATAAESQQIGELAGEAMEAGALGVSTSRFDRDPDSRLVPSWYADDAEFHQLCGAIQPYEGVLQVIPTQDDKHKWDDDLRRLGRFSAQYGCGVFSNHIGQRPDDPDNAPRLLQLAREITAAGGRFRHMISPRSIDIVMNFYQSMVFIFVPAWNEVLQGRLSREQKKTMLADQQWRARARADFDKSTIPGDLIKLYQFIQTQPQHEAWIGRRFGELLTERGGHPSDVLADWGLQNDLEAELLYPLTNTDPKIVGELLDAPENLISGSDAGAHIAMFDGAGDSTLVLTRHVRERGDLTLERAIHRLTQDQAEFLGLKDRGVVARGAIADLAVFNLEELDYGHAVKLTDVPGGFKRFRRPGGQYRYTLIDGHVVQSYGKVSEALPGRFLQKQDRVAS